MDIYKALNILEINKHDVTNIKDIKMHIEKNLY